MDQTRNVETEMARVREVIARHSEWTASVKLKIKEYRELNRKLETELATVKQKHREQEELGKRQVAQLEIERAKTASLATEILELKRTLKSQQLDLLSVQAENARLWTATERPPSKRDSLRRSRASSSRASLRNLDGFSEKLSAREKLQQLKEMKVSSKLIKDIFDPLPQEFVYEIKLQQTPPVILLSVTKAGVPSVRQVDVQPHSDDWKVLRFWASNNEISVDGAASSPASKRKSVKL